jgi:hypothetical protein
MSEHEINGIRFRPLTDDERRATTEAPDIDEATIVNGVAFKLTGKTYTVPGIAGVFHEATIKRECHTDDLVKLHGAEVLGIGRVSRVERFVTMTQAPGFKIGLLVPPAQAASASAAAAASADG